MKKTYILSLHSLVTCLLLFLFIGLSDAQQTVTIGAEDLNPRAILRLQGNGNQGLMLPIADKDDFIPLAEDSGMFIYDNSDNLVYFWNGSAWVSVNTSTGGGSNFGLVLDVATGNLSVVENGGNSNVSLSTINLTGDITGTIDNNTIGDGAVTLNKIANNGNARSLLANSSGGVVAWLVPNNDNQVLGTNGSGDLVFRDVVDQAAGIASATSASDSRLVTEAAIRDALDAAGVSQSMQAAYEGENTISMSASRNISIQTSSTYPIFTLEEASGFAGFGDVSPTARLTVRHGGTGTGEALELRGDGTNALPLLFWDEDDTSFGGIAAPSTITSPYVLTLPSDLPTAPGQVLTSDVSGNLSWSSTGTSSLQTAYDGDGTINMTSDSDLSISASGDAGSTPIFYIDEDASSSLGQIGIGTTSPSGKLHVAGGSTETDLIRLTTNSAIGTLMDFVNNSANSGSFTIGYLANTSPGPGFFTILDESAGVHRFVVTNNGDVGIGNTTPTQRLDVNGNIRVSVDNGFFLGDVSFLSGSTTDDNVFVGGRAGNSLTSGTANVFVGTNAGGSTNNVTGNTFVGNNAGLFNTAGGSNLFVGGGAGEFNETGSNNVFVGTGSGATNISGNQITLLGIGADVATDGFFNATAIGSGAIVGQNNSLILGSGADVGIGTSTPNANLEISGSGLTFQRISSTSGDVALELFRSGNSNVDYRFFADSSDDFLKLQTSSDDLGTTSDALVIADNGEVGIGINPSSSLHVRHPGSTSNASLGEGISISNATRSTRWTITHQYNILPSLENLEFSFDGTRKGSISQSNGAYSSVSDIRLKKNIGDMADVLNDVMKLRPVNYHFNQQSDQDLANMGFIAQEVLKVFPSLVSGSGKRKSSGEIDYHTMNYAGMSVVSIKAIQEQQKIINQQSIEIEQLKEQLTENSLQHSSTQSELDQLKAQVEMLTNLIKAEASND